MVADLPETLSLAIEAGRRLSPETGEIELSPEQIDQLRALGYVDGTRSAHAGRRALRDDRTGPPSIRKSRETRATASEPVIASLKPESVGD